MSKRLHWHDAQQKADKPVAAALRRAAATLDRLQKGRASDGMEASDVRRVIELEFELNAMAARYEPHV